MKKHSIIPLFAAVLMGVSASAYLAGSEPAAIHAEAGYSVHGITSSGIEYYHDDAAGSEITISGYKGTSQTVVIPDYIDGRKVTAIQELAFSPYLNNGNQPANITSVTIPNTIRTIGFRAFYKVPLTKLSLPASVVLVDQEAFSCCQSLKELKIYGKTEIGLMAFDGCKNLNSVDIKENAVLDFCAFNNCKNLQTLIIRKASSLGACAFKSCKNLKSIQIADGCTYDQNVFTDCTSLEKVNGHRVVKYSATNMGVQQPYFNSDTSVRNLVRYTFTNCSNVGFLHKFCEDYCAYIVASETDPWMSDAVKARQLHYWLVRCCDYDQREAGDNPPSYQENHSPYSVFVSYELDGHGKTVCEGFAKAYTMLLKKANIESYVLLGKTRIAGRTNHIWNLVKLGDRYYECDVTWDNSQYDKGNSVAFGTNYRYFMKNSVEMQQLHKINGLPAYYLATLQTYSKEDHDLLVYDKDQGEQVLHNTQNILTRSFTDTNTDGIRDGDYDLDGLGGEEDYWDDLLARQQLAGTIYGYDTDINNKLSNVVYRLHLEYVMHTMGY